MSSGLATDSIRKAYFVNGQSRSPRYNGAFLAKYGLRGDLHAVKMAYRQARYLVFGGEAVARQVRDRGTALRAVVVGALRRLLHSD